MRAPVKDCKRKSSCASCPEMEAGRLRSVSRLNQTCESVHGSFWDGPGDPLTIARWMTFAEERNTEEEERERKIPLCSERRKAWRRENTELCITKKINVGSLRRVVIRIS